MSTITLGTRNISNRAGRRRVEQHDVRNAHARRPPARWRDTRPYRAATTP